MSEDERTLSSAGTFFLKWVFPPVWITPVASALIGVWAGVVICIAYFVLTSVGSYKRVRLRGRTFLISNYLKEIEVPLEDVEAFTENKWVKGHPISIHFRRPTDFGEKITFLPPTEFVWPWDSHPLFDELHALLIRR